MWIRAELKDKAKGFLKKSYWPSFVVSLVILIAGGSHNGFRGGNSSNSNNDGGLIFGSSPNYFHFDGNSNRGLFRELSEAFQGEYGYVAMTVFFFIIVLALGYRIFLGYALEVGGRSYFNHAALDGTSEMNHLGSSFKEGRYFPIIRGMIRRGLGIFVWTLLLIIPGIIAGYSWRMVPYILGENPQIGAKRALRLSRAMTMNHKWNIFVLDLSFLGWYLLGVLALIVGVLFVKPYDDATNGHLYRTLRAQAIETGLTSEEELNPHRNVLAN